MLKTVHLRMLLLLAVAIALPVVGFSLDSATRVWTFDDDSPESLPPEFQVGTLFDGRPAGEWKILQTEVAKNGTHVLGQLMGKGAEHAYKVVLIQGTEATDLDVRVSILPISGKADMGGGLIWRATDDRNYYLTRANPLEQNIRVYRVVKGIRHLLQNFDQTIVVKEWHTLQVINRGCRIQVFYDEKQVFDLCDETFSAGRIGLWTKSDAVTYFDNLRLQLLR
jgi:3-keto-disaccharide hydrolase